MRLYRGAPGTARDFMGEAKMDTEELQALRETHRRWLTKLKILDKPWLVLGSAPHPTLPPDIVAHCARMDVNNAGKTANMLGLPAADVTFRKRKKSWEEHPDVRTRGLLWLHTRPLWVMRLKLLMKPSVRYHSLMRATKEEREAIVEHMCGGLPGDIGETGHVTNGVAALCYALFVGVPSVTLAGFSLTVMGHSYNEKGSTRRQIAEDTYVLSKLRERPDVFTTEQGLSDSIGIRHVYGLQDILEIPRADCSRSLTGRH
ncbi:hypothetical protein C8J35_10776 [Rhizobium sp. PP-F2F-G38]|nr:hypothetical protein [Ferranicluibacter rubi]PYE32489.1 hypothetical protein C8J37_10776 [Rhizobium sp. PP-WC-1G-195]PYE95917.1 hypothetical protein C8J35_10776 [Rhizobium sp. PP-F2F-G38]TCP88477.1 hypothetical protein C8J31_103330 [Rhizobium sp. PP-CC-2G-626]TCQ22857.1 hypothetical protein C8J33_10576 [Rhizobium sp. PP-CC-3G-465]